MGASCQFKQEFESDIVAGECLSAALQQVLAQQTSLHQHHHHLHHPLDSPPQLAKQLVAAYQHYCKQQGSEPKLALDQLSSEDLATLHQLILLQQQLRSAQRTPVRCAKTPQYARPAPSSSEEQHKAVIAAVRSSPLSQGGKQPALGSPKTRGPAKSQKRLSGFSGGSGATGTGSTRPITASSREGGGGGSSGIYAARQAVRAAEKQLWGAVVEAQAHNEYDAITKNHFNFQYCVGRGGFGKVWKVEKKKNKKLFAMKEMSKARIISKRSVNSVMNERKLLSQLKHPFLVNMSYAFQDQKNLYLIMDLLSGGDLRFHLAKRRRFSEQQTRFFIACIVMSLEYLHNNGILHRDVKPENLIFDHRGFLRLTDLGIARLWNPENAQDTSGTPGYMAPEVMCRQNHGVAVDYFATGVIAYECMMGRRPYLGRSRKEIRDQILAKQVQVKRHEIPEGWSLEAANFINKMIQRKPMNRLGLNGPEEVKEHPWLRDFPWDELYHKHVLAPYIPNCKEDNFDPRTCQEPWKDQEDPEVQKEQQEMLRRKSVQDLFQGYYYDFTMIVPRECYQSSAAMAGPETFSAATAATTGISSTVSTPPVKKQLKASFSRPHSPTQSMAQVYAQASSAANSPRESKKSGIAIHHQHSHSSTGCSTPSMQTAVSRPEKQSSSFSRGFKGPSLRNSVLDEKYAKYLYKHKP